MEAPPEPTNPRRTLANWRILSDKAVLVSQLLGREESVRSWLPQASMETPYSAPASEDLARIIVDAVPLEPMKPSVEKNAEDFAGEGRPEQEIREVGDKFMAHCHGVAEALHRRP